MNRIKEKKIIIENYDGAKFLSITTEPLINLFETVIAATLTSLKPEEIGQLFTEFTSSKQIVEANQTNNFSFSIPIGKGKFQLYLVIHTESEGVKDFNIQRIY